MGSCSLSIAASKMIKAGIFVVLVGVATTAPLTSNEVATRVVAVSKAVPELLSAAVSGADPDLLRVALTDANPDLLEIALTRADADLLKVALTQGVNPGNLRVALTEVSYFSVSTTKVRLRNLNCRIK